MSVSINVYYLRLDVFSEKSISFHNPYATVSIPQ